MSWINWEYACQECDLRVDELFKRNSVPDFIECKSCGAEMARQLGGNPTRASFPDGHVPASRTAVTRELAASYKLESKGFEHKVGSEERKGLLKEAKKRKATK